MSRLLPLLVAILAGCGERELVVDSSTSWSGYVAGSSGSSIDGSGNERFPIGGGLLCWNFQKNTEQGHLRVYMSTPSLTGTSKRGFAETTAAYGVVSGCSDE